MAKQFFLIIAIIGIVQVSKGAPLPDDATSEPEVTTTTEPPASILEYSYEPSENGGTYSYHTTNGVYREETVEIVNKGTPDEYNIIRGLLRFRADDKFKYTINYTIDKDGNTVTVERFAIHRIPPNTLKSLIG